MDVGLALAIEASLFGASLFGVASHAELSTWLIVNHWVTLGTSTPWRRSVRSSSERPVRWKSTGSSVVMEAIIRRRSLVPSPRSLSWYNFTHVSWNIWCPSSISSSRHPRLQTSMRRPSYVPPREATSISRVAAGACSAAVGQVPRQSATSPERTRAGAILPAAQVPPSMQSASHTSVDNSEASTVVDGAAAVQLALLDGGIVGSQALHPHAHGWLLVDVGVEQTALL